MRRGSFGVRRVCALMLCACALAGCGANREDEPRVEDVVAEVNSFTSELVRRVETAPDAGAGVEDAQKFLDSRREELTAQVAAVKKSKEYREDESARARFMEAEADNAVVRVGGLRTRHMNRAMTDEAFRAKLDKLLADYNTIYAQH